MKSQAERIEVVEESFAAAVVAGDGQISLTECRGMMLELDRRLRALGTQYGALPAHDGLWEAAAGTAHDVAARLAVVPMVLEARGLDVTPATLASFERAGDARSAAILGRIYRDEIRHVRVGTSWFKSLCESRDLVAAAEWQRLIRAHFRGIVKPPFNDSARGEAGLSRDFYAGVAPGEPA